jgi:hypothetical protein
MTLVDVVMDGGDLSPAAVIPCGRVLLRSADDVGPGANVLGLIFGALYMIWCAVMIVLVFTREAVSGRPCVSRRGTATSSKGKTSQ